MRSTAAHILVVDDNEDNLKLVQYLLKEFGHAPVGRDGAEAGLQAALREPFDLILIDILMPGIDGFELARRIRSEPLRSHTPLVALTALAMVGDRDRILASGFVGYISKPIKPRSFVMEVDAYLPPEKRSQRLPRLMTGASELPNPVVPRKAVVLVVDDVPENIGVIRAAIEPFGYHVVGTASVRQALAAAREQMPDLVVTDIHLSAQTGFDLLGELKSDDSTRSIPVMFVTSSKWSERDIALAVAAGVERVLERPIQPTRLLEEVEGALKVGSRG
jgi:two-component system, cell cycle response regulator